MNSTVAAGDIVQKIFAPSTRQPDSVRVAVVTGWVRSWPGSLTAVAMIAPSWTTSVNVSPNAEARRTSPSAAAMRQRRATLPRTAMCMFTPMASEASPRARREAATTRSCSESTPRPPSSLGTGAVK